MNIQTTGTIRKRRQLTIPDEIGKRFPWIKEDAVVFIEGNYPDRIVITPLNATKTDTPDWDLIWKMIKRSRAIKGRGTMSASEFIALDRQNH